MSSRYDDVGAERDAHVDAGRPAAVGRRRERSAWTARERIDALLDPGSFFEYGMLARPADRRLDGPADGLVTGTGTVARRTVVAAAYDYTVIGGSQSPINHRKLDRMLRLAGEHRWPVAMLLEGGGARAQELDLSSAFAPTFATLARLSGRVPIVSAVLGPAFAGHATLAGLSDVVVALRGATMGMAGPPLVQARVGRRLSPEEIGATAIHAAAGAVDIVVDDEPAAIRAVRRYLAFSTPVTAPVDAPEDQRVLRSLVPESSRRAYDIRAVLTALADRDSVLELRPAFAANVVTALARIEGHRAGVIANQPLQLAGAIDTTGSDKLARFVALCDAHGLPIVFLVDTPGFLVGPDVEQSALVRHSARIAYALARVRVPILTVVLRKAYGLAYYLMGSPAFDPVLLVEWPLAEYGGMGLDGAAAILDSGESALAHVERLREEHGARAAAGKYTVDDMITPEETRTALARTLARLSAPDADCASRGIDPW